ncbi:MAG TPA: malto-oligosyltrehalose synthase, partial [Pedobacter sp.]|nr:malto-oligosyltrehalose synthase [Pedobacter sp.]
TQDVDLKAVNADANLLKKLLDTQYYRLCNWEETNEHINYRRFFTVNALICLNIQDQKVFNAFHRYIFELVGKGVFQGLRIDHIDGLFDPTQYLNRLRAAIGQDCYLVVEKILHRHEHLPSNWPVQGSTGYDFLAMVNNLLTNKRAEPSFDHVYRQVIGKNLIVDEQALLKKSTFLHRHMAGELDNLHQLFLQLKLADQAQLKTLPEGSLKGAIADFLVHCPVYRYYGNKFPLSTNEKAQVKAIFESLDFESPNRKAHKLLEAVLLGSNHKACLFYQRCMQFSGPLAAKGIEDTLMYTYNRFIGHDEVGDAPELFGLTTAEFHQLMIERQQEWPLTINATSTHDTKRGEDVRARLNVLTDIPSVWKQVVKDLDFKDLHKNDLYLIYQTIFGIWPMPGQSHAGLADRLALYIEKALREAKKRSDWAEPNEGYEQLVKLFVQKFLSYPNRKNTVLNTFLANVADFGIINSLSQEVLKFTCPGIPDCYQGTELWELSLVDPDNRRDVDFKMGKRILEKISKQQSITQLWQNRYTGEIKLWLTHGLLTLRNTHRPLFAEGEYLPLQCKGKYAAHVFAFARKLNNEWIITVVPLGQAALCKGDQHKLVGFDWQDTLVQLPNDAPSIWENALTQEKLAKDIHQGGILIKNIFKEVPIAVLKMAANDRGSGILLHMSSLPSSFGIGDLGPTAYQFIDFLKSAKQKYWQLLPVNPIASNQGYSPYSTSSSMAGNVLFISPEELHTLNLLSDDQLSLFRNRFNSKINYPKVERQKGNMLALAYQNFVQSDQHEVMKKEFAQFCVQEKEWLVN